MFTAPIDGTFQLKQKLGNGSFGDVYAAVNRFNGLEVAVKLEKSDNPHPQLDYEAYAYECLSGLKGFPFMYRAGKMNGYNFLVMDLLGPSLESLFEKCNRRFSLKTVCMLADQMITRLEQMHQRQFLHRDVKPDNFMMGLDRNARVVFVADFGLAKRYIASDGRHIAFRTGKHLTGTARYASLNSHAGYELGRRDDMESIGYMIIYFLRGSLPWQGIHGVPQDKRYSHIGEIKRSIALDILCHGLPDEIKQFMAYVRALRFEETPNYKWLRSLFRAIMYRFGYKTDHVYDWAVSVPPPPFRHYPQVYARQTPPQHLHYHVPVKVVAPPKPHNHQINGINERIATIDLT